MEKPVSTDSLAVASTAKIFVFLLALSACPPRSQVECRLQSDCSEALTCQSGHCVSPDSGTCNVTCADWEECVPSPSGGSCNDLNLTFTWESPAENLTYCFNSWMYLSLAVTRPDGGAFQKPVPYTWTEGLPGELTELNRYSRSVGKTMFGGQQTITVGWPDGGPFSVRHYFVDVIPPALALVVTADGGSFQRDTVTTGILTSNENIYASYLTLGGVEMSQLLDAGSCENFYSTPNAKECFQLDFSKAPLNGLSGNFNVALTAVDGCLNRANVDGGLSVTRVRWEACADGLCAPGTSVTALAINSDGQLEVGLTKSTVTGAIVEMSAARGSPTLPIRESGAIQSLASHGALTYFASNDNTNGGQIGAVGAGVTPACTIASASNLTYSGIALIQDSIRGVGAIGAINSGMMSDGTGCVYFPVSTSVPFGSNSSIYNSYATSGASSPSVAVNVVIAKAFSSSPVASFLTIPVSAGAWWQPVADFVNGASPIPAVPLTSMDGRPPIGQALLPNGDFLIATFDNDDTNTAIGRLTVDGGASLTSGNFGHSETMGTPVVASSEEAYAGQGNGLYRFNPDALGAAFEIAAEGNDTFLLSPILGKPQHGDSGLGYAITKGGNLVVFKTGNTDDAGTPLAWQTSVSSSTVLTHPTLDCNRQSRHKNRYPLRRHERRKSTGHHCRFSWPLRHCRRVA